MKHSRKRFAQLTKLVSLTVLLVMVTFVSKAEAHQWTLKIDGKSMKVEAKVVDFNGRQVLLENEKGQQKAFEINELNDRDLSYLKDLLVAKQTTVLEELGNQQLEAEQVNVKLHYFDVWELMLHAPNGDYMTRQYFARSNEEARHYALQEYPSARIGWARKLRHRSNSS